MRKARFWRKHEKKLMNSMGMKATAGSGNTWIEKEDGESEHFIAQSKATQKKSITLKREDVKTLFENAAVMDKIPVFVLSFVDKYEEYELVAFDKADAMRFIEMANAEESDG